MQKLLACRVRPYYIYQADMIAGTEHFRTTVEKGLEIIKGLRGWTSGLAVPHFVIDSPGGGGKIPILPSYVESIDNEKVVLRNYKGEQYIYKQVQSKSEITRQKNANFVMPLCDDPEGQKAILINQE